MKDANQNLADYIQANAKELISRHAGRNAKNPTHQSGIATFEEIKEEKGFQCDPESLLFRKFGIK